MANFAPAKPHMAGILSALTTLAGIVTTAAGYIAQGTATAQAAGLHLPPAVITTGIVLTTAGGVLQAVTKPVHAGDTNLVPK